MTTYAIGDIHGRGDELIYLMEEVIGVSRGTDTLIPLGDIVDGGYRSDKALEYLSKMPHVIPILGNHDCLTPDAEVLTTRGWKQYNEIQNEDVVFSFDKSSETGVWMPITETIVKEHNGEVISINSTRIRFRSTPNHRVFCRKRIGGGRAGKRKWSEYCYINASNISGRIKIISCAKNSNLEFPITDNEIRLSAWVLTDGHIDKHGYVSIYQSKPARVEEITALLNNLGYSYRIYERHRNTRAILGKNIKTQINPQVTFGIHAESSKKIKLFLPEKKMPDWVLKLSCRQFSIFLDTLILGDGSIYRGKNTTAILYGSLEFLGKVQSACATNGYTATLVTDNRGNPRLNVCQKQTIEFDCGAKTTSEKYSGLVWCISTPLSNFMVRQGGTTFFTGNSWALWWFETGIALPEWRYQGGEATMGSYGFEHELVPERHVEFLKGAKLCFVDKKNRIFVHGGFLPLSEIHPCKQSKDILMWDRDIIRYAIEKPIPGFRHVFIGHTSTGFYDYDLPPLTFNNLTMLDTGAGWSEGKLTAMNINTFEWWQVPVFKEV